MHKFLHVYCSLAALLFAIAEAHGATTAPTSAPLSSPYLATTAKDFADVCTTDQGGCEDIVGNALMDKIVFSATSHICITSPDYAKAVPGWLIAHPETASMTPEDGIFLALRKLYAC